MDELRIDQLTKEMVAEQLRLLGDPCAAAAAVVRKTLSIALSGLPAGGTPPALVIEDAVKGGMTALLLADQSLPHGAVLVLEVVHEIANERNIDVTEALRAALSGLVDLRRFMTPERVEEVRKAIETRFMGAGDLYAEFVTASEAKAA